jgi:hypothetical protein
MGAKKDVKNIKLDDYVENKLLSIKNILVQNKTLISLATMGCAYYAYKFFYL